MGGGGVVEVVFITPLLDLNGGKGHLQCEALCVDRPESVSVMEITPSGSLNLNQQRGKAHWEASVFLSVQSTNIHI